MLEERSSDCSGRGWARTCDSCRAATCAVYCQADSAYLCVECDTHIHTANRVALRHERVWVCEACERAPAAFTCKADAALLCTACDADIHSANILARRHQRTPVVPISSGCLYGPPASHHDRPVGSLAVLEGSFLAPEVDEEEKEVDEDEDETASWLILNSHNTSNNNNNAQSNGYLFGCEVDNYLDLVEYNSCNENQYNQEQHNQVEIDGRDSIFSIHCGTVKEEVDPYNLHTSSVNHGLIDLFPTPPLQMPLQFTSKDREARVLRYREKRKTRKFEKTIRYASRKAYAETRPRIKGRFAKRTDVEVQVEQMFSTTVMDESRYGIVPSF